MLAAKRPLMSAERLKMLAAKLPQRCSERSWHKGTTAERVSRLLRAGGHVSSETLLVGCLAQDLKGRINEANLIDEGERIKVQVSFETLRVGCLALLCPCFETPCWAVWHVSFETLPVCCLALFFRVSRRSRLGCLAREFRDAPCGLSGSRSQRLPFKSRWWFPVWSNRKRYR